MRRLPLSMLCIDISDCQIASVRRKASLFTREKARRASLLALTFNEEEHSKRLQSSEIGLSCIHYPGVRKDSFDLVALTRYDLKTRRPRINDSSTAHIRSLASLIT